MTQAIYTALVKVRYQAITFLLLISCFSCHINESKKPIIYNGPLSQSENLIMHYTENNRIKTILKAKKALEFQNGDREFPAGIYIEFFGEDGTITSTLQANSAYFLKDENKWRGRGKVMVKNIAKNQQLNSEELFWMPALHKIFTEKFVTVTDADGIIYGTGMEAADDASSYTIKNPSGSGSVKEE